MIFGIAKWTAYLTIALIVGLCGSASAGTLYTPPVSVETGKALECKILNVGNGPRLVRLDIRTDDNELASDIAIPFTSLDPGKVLSFAASSGPCFNGLTCRPSYCVFDVQGSRRSVRASACVRDAGGCLTAVAAE